MAVDRAKRGGGIGSQLFHDACGADSNVARYVLIEVEDEEEVTLACPKTFAAPAAARRSTAHMAAANSPGCHTLMPTVSAQRPPRMNLLVYLRDLPETIDSTELRGWLAAIYAEVYRQSVSDTAYRADAGVSTTASRVCDTRTND